ncbi:MAG TPA: nuclear transport factor 2 family protein, partial [Polyangiaceae bacterium]|nr:nuclear transport factor 2 family protein [Polyangiaceae bacterium]
AGQGAKRFDLEQVAQVGECVVVAGTWRTAEGSRGETGRFYQVLRVRDGLIVDIQGCASRRAAMAYARRAA